MDSEREEPAGGGDSVLTEKEVSVEEHKQSVETPPPQEEQKSELTDPQKVESFEEEPDDFQLRALNAAAKEKEKEDERAQAALAKAQASPKKEKKQEKAKKKEKEKSFEVADEERSEGGSDDEIHRKPRQIEDDNPFVF